MISGQVASVESRALGAPLVGDHASGVSTLAVDFAADFSEDGGTLTVGGLTLAFTAVDPDTDIVTLAAPTAAALYDGDPVQVVTAGAVAVEWTANVALDEDDGGDMVPALVPTPMVPYLAEGTYDLPVPVEVDLVGDGFRVVSLPNVQPLMDGSFIDAATLPPPDVSDGIAPGAAAAPVTLGGLKQIFVRWPAVVLNASGGAQVDPVRYEVHVSTTNPPAMNSTSLLTTTPATLVAVKALPDDTAFAFDTSYYFAVRPLDDDGAGTASPVVSGQMDRAAAGDLAANSVTAETLAGIMVLGSTISTRSLDGAGLLTGPGLDLTPDGLFTYNQAGEARVELPNDTDLPAVFRGDAEIDHLTVATLTTLQESMLSQGSTMTMESGIGNPGNPPAPTVQWQGTQHTDDGYWGSRVGWSTDGTYYYSVRAYSTAHPVLLEKWSSAGALISSTALTDAFGFDGVVTGGCWVPAGAWGAAHYAYVYRITGNDWVLISSTGTYVIDLPTTVAQAGNSLYVALGYDAAAGDLLFGQSRTDIGNKVRICRTDLATAESSGVVVRDSYVDGPTAYANHLSHVSYGTYDFSDDRYIYATFSGFGFAVIDAAGSLNVTASADANNEWPHGLSGIRGLLWNGSAFVTVSSTGLRRTFEAGNKWSGAQTETWHASYAWTNGATSTRPASPASFTMSKRAQVKVTTPTLPSGVTGTQIYLSKGSVPNPAVSSMTANGATTGTTQPTLTEAAAVFTPLNNPTTNGFGAATPANIRSAVSDVDGPIIDLWADGSGRVGPYSWDTAGAYADTGWVNLTSPANWGAGTAKYRVTEGRFLQVQMSGSKSTSVSVTANGGITVEIFTGIPVGSRITGESVPFLCSWGGMIAHAVITTSGDVRINVVDATGAARTIGAAATITGRSGLTLVGT